MQRNPLRRISPKQRAYGIVGGVFLAMVLIALLAGTPQNKPALAQVAATGTPTSVNPSCTQPAADGTTTCTFTTQTNFCLQIPTGTQTTTLPCPQGTTPTTQMSVAAGGTMTIQLTNPNATNGGKITQLTGVPPGCAISSGIGSPIVTLSCAIASLGIPAGTVLTETVSLGTVASTTAFVTESVTYDANGPAPQVPNPTSESCAPVSSCVASPGCPAGIPPATPPATVTVSVTCTLTPSLTTVSGGKLTVTVTGTSGGTVQITSALNDIGSPDGPCFLQTAIPQPASPGQTATISYLCGIGASVPAPPVPGQLPLQISYTLTGSTSPAAGSTITVIENSNGTISNPTNAFPEILTIAPCGTLPSTVGASAPCPAVAAPLPAGSVFPTQAGFTMAVQITASVGQTITVAAGNAAATDGNCTLQTPPPVSASFPEGTLVVSYACPPGGVGSTAAPAITVTNTNGVSGTPIETIAVIAPQPPPGVPPAVTASLTFIVAGIGGNPTAVPPVTVTAPAGTSFCSIAVTPVPGNCFTFNSNCVNPAGLGLPQPAAANGAPAISTNGPYTGAIGQPLQLKGTAVPAFGSLITTCVWDFGDTSAASHYLSPTHVYTISGTYTATLTVTALTVSCTGTTNAGGATCTCSNSGNGVTKCAWTVVATTSVSIGALPPLCQQPLLPSLTGLSLCGGGGCPATSFNNQCRPTCPLTTETLLPNQCPGPATGSQVTINGPLQVAVNQPVIINANLNLPDTSDLLRGDYLRFDFGDGAVITNVPPLAFNPNGSSTGSSSSSSLTISGPTIPFPGNGGGPTQCADGTVSNSSGSGTCSDHGGEASNSSSGSGGPQVLCADRSAAPYIGSGTCANNGGIQPGQPAPDGAVFPASTQAAHAYTQAGTYTVTVEVTFSDGTTAVAKTTVTVAGQGASLPTTAAPLSGPPVVATTVALQSGCNTVTLTFPDGTPIATVAAAIQGTTLSAIYETPANAPELAYYADPTLTSNLATVQHGDQASVCVQGAGSLVQPAS